MLSDFRIQKLAGMFRFNDEDRDGRVTASDFERVAGNYAELYNVDRSSPEAQELARGYSEQWNQIKGFDSDGDGVVIFEEYLAGMEAWLADREAFMSSIDTTIAAFYKVVDRDGDGRISEDELVLNWRAHGLEEALARKVFAKLDRDGDGAISKEEMVANIEEAMYAENPDAPGNWLALQEA